MKKKSLIVTSALVLVGAAGASLAAASIIAGPVVRDKHSIEIASATSVTSPGSPSYYSCGVVTSPAPSDGFLDCIAPGHQLTDLFWSQWGKDKAVGTGRIGFASCLCDDPTYTWYPVDVVLTDPTKVRNGTVFSDLTVHYTGSLPPSEPAEKTYSLTTPGAQPDDQPHN